MIFPKLITDDIEYPLPSGGYVKKYKLDWSVLDDRRVESKKSWLSYGLDKLTPYQRNIFINEILEECDWYKYISIPKEYEYVFDMFEYIYLTDSYYKEILHFEKLALEEWNRFRPFDTAVREKCLSVAIASVDMYFYLLGDGVYIYNSRFNNIEPIEDEKKYKLYKSREEIMLPVLWKYKFWKHQTGGGLVVDRAFSLFGEKTKEYDFMKSLKSSLVNNLSDILLENFINCDKKVEYIKSYIRDKRLQKIL